MKPSFFRLTALITMLAFGIFALGAAFHKYRPFPYDLVKTALADVGRHIDRKDAPDYSQRLSRQYTRDFDKVIQDKDIDTALLPLRVKGVRISEQYPVPKVGGAITAIGNTTIVLDRLGNLYSSGPGGDNLKKLLVPELPNNIAEYLAQPGAVVDDKRFRAYSVKYLKFANLLAVSHEYFDKQYNKSRLAVSVIAIDDKSSQPIGSWKTIFLGDPEPQGPNEQGGGHLAVQGPDKIYLSVGDYENDPTVSQNVNSKMGKIFEINLNTRNVKMVSLGHRNPEGLIVTTDGTLLSTEHGPSGGDELNLIVEGANYGWPIVTLGTGYNRYDWRGTESVGKHDGYQAPVFAWVPSIAVSSLLQVRGFDRRWDGDLLVASLKAQSLFRLRLDKWNVLYSEPIWIGQRIRDTAQLQDGTIVLWTDDTELQFISVDQQKLELNKRNPLSTSSTLVGACMYCHHFGPTKATDFAPSLTNVLGRKIGSDNFRYSAALRSKNGGWTEQSLRDFISNPDEFASGTAMPNLHLSESDLDDVLKDLTNNTNGPSFAKRH